MTHTRKGFSLVEAIVSIAIFGVGAVLIILLFPQTLRSAYDAELQTKAALLGQMKVEEIRRDDDQLRSINAAIAIQPEPTDAVLFGQEPELSYAFSGRSLLYRDSNPPVPEGDDGIARVLVLRSRGGKPPTRPIHHKEVLYEVRFAP